MAGPPKKPWNFPCKYQRMVSHDFPKWCGHPQARSAQPHLKWAMASRASAAAPRRPPCRTAAPGPPAAAPCPGWSGWPPLERGVEGAASKARLLAVESSRKRRGVGGGMVETGGKNRKLPSLRVCFFLGVLGCNIDSRWSSHFPLKATGITRFPRNGLQWTGCKTTGTHRRFWSIRKGHAGRVGESGH